MTYILGGKLKHKQNPSGLRHESDGMMQLTRNGLINENQGPGTLSLVKEFEGRGPSSVKGSALYNPAKGHGLWKPEANLDQGLDTLIQQLQIAITR